MLKLQSRASRQPAELSQHLESQTVRVGGWSERERLAFRSGMARRAQHMIGGALGSELCSMFLSDTDEQRQSVREGYQHLQELCARADQGDGEAQQELQEIRIWSVQNLLLAGANYAGFFAVENLEEGDVPFIENTTRQEAMIAMVGQDGGEPLWQVQLAWTKTPISAFWLTSNEFEYPLIDEYTGAVADRAKSAVDIAFDFNMKLDFVLFGKLQGLIGAFNNEGDPATRVYVPHSRINVANLPTTNLLVPADNTSTSLFRKSCMDAIMAYAKAWGDNAFTDGPLRPMTVYVPSAHITGFLDEVEVSNPNNEYNAQVFEFGVIMNYAGQRWTFIADPTLDPAAGLAYVKFNKPLAKLYTKTALDVLIVDNSPAKRKNNLESQLERKVFFCAIPNQARINIAAVQYRTV